MYQWQHKFIFFLSCSHLIKRDVRPVSKMMNAQSLKTMTCKFVSLLGLFSWGKHSKAIITAHLIGEIICLVILPLLNMTIWMVYIWQFSLFCSLFITINSRKCVFLFLSLEWKLNWHAFLSESCNMTGTYLNFHFESEPTGNFTQMECRK